MTSATKRLTRAERQERTRALLVEAATRLFLRDGFSGTSLEEIGEEAGFTRGAVYSNFTSKTAIGLAVIEELYARAERRLEAALETAKTDGSEAWFAALSGWAESTLGDPRWARLEIEVGASSARGDAHRSATAARYARQRARCAELIDELFPGALPVDSDTLAAAVVGLGIGIGVQRAADPRVASTAWSEVVRALLKPATAGRPAPPAPAADAKTIGEQGTA